MRKLVFLITLLTVALIACASPQTLYKAGTYQGIAEGYHSNLTVEVTTNEFKIVEIIIVEEDETPLIGEIVYAEIPKAVIKANSTKVDVVAGATYTSETLLAAIEDGLIKARIESTQANELDDSNKDEE